MYVPLKHIPSPSIYLISLDPPLTTIDLCSTHLDDFLEVVILLLPAVQGHELCLVIVPHPGHSLLADSAVVRFTDVLMVHHPVTQREIPYLMGSWKYNTEEKSLI